MKNEKERLPSYPLRLFHYFLYMYNGAELNGIIISKVRTGHTKTFTSSDCSYGSYMLINLILISLIRKWLRNMLYK